MECKPHKFSHSFIRPIVLLLLLLLLAGINKQPSSPVLRLMVMSLGSSPRPLDTKETAVWLQKSGQRINPTSSSRSP